MNEMSVIKFEYKIVYEPPKIGFEDFLNELGDEGWELIMYNNICNSLTGIATFKRLKPLH